MKWPLQQQWTTAGWSKEKTRDFIRDLIGFLTRAASDYAASTDDATRTHLASEIDNARAALTYVTDYALAAFGRQVVR